MDDFSANLKNLSAEHRDFYLANGPMHLASAGWTLQFQQVLTTFPFLQAKVEMKGLGLLIDDYELAYRGELGIPQEVVEELRLIQRALLLSGGVIVRELSQLRSHLYGRLQAYNRPVIRALIEQILHHEGQPWLRPLMPTLISPAGPLRRRLSGHTRTVVALAVTEDASIAISGSYDRTIRIWDLQHGVETFQLFSGAEEWVASDIKLLPDGSSCVCACTDHTIRIINMRDGRRQHIMRESHSIYAIALTPDGTHVLSALDNGAISVWDIRSASIVLTMQGHSDHVNAMAITGDGRRAVSASGDSTLMLWDLDTGTMIQHFVGHKGSVASVAITPDDRYILSGSDDSTLILWDLNTGAQVRRFAGHGTSDDLTPHYVHSIAITLDGRRAISAADSDPTLRVWDMDTGQLISILSGHQATVNRVVLALGGRVAVTASSDDTLHIWDMELATGAEHLPGHSKEITGVRITRDGHYAVSISKDSTVKVWRAKQHDANLTATFSGHQGYVKTLVMLPNGKRVISGAQDNTLRVWSLAGNVPPLVLAGHQSHGTISKIQATPDGHRAVSASSDRTLIVWDLDQGTVLHRLHGHSGAVRDVAITPDGKHAVSASEDNTLMVWDLKTGQQKSSLRGHTAQVLAVTAMSNTRVVSVSFDRTTRVWNLKTATEQKRIEHCGGVPLAIGHRRLIASTDIADPNKHTLFLWDLDDDAFIQILDHSEWAIAVTGDAHYLLALAEDELHLWDLTEPRIVAQFIADCRIVDCALSANAKTVVLGDALGGVHILRLEDGKR